jgi:hypothetical protein
MVNGLLTEEVLDKAEEIGRKLNEPVIDKKYFTPDRSDELDKVLQNVNVYYFPNIIKRKEIVEVNRLGDTVLEQVRQEREKKKQFLLPKIVIYPANKDSAERKQEIENFIKGIDIEYVKRANADGLSNEDGIEFLNSITGFLTRNGFTLPYTGGITPGSQKMFDEQIGFLVEVLDACKSFYAQKDELENCDLTDDMYSDMDPIALLRRLSDGDFLLEGFSKAEEKIMDQIIRTMSKDNSGLLYLTSHYQQLNKDEKQQGKNGFEQILGTLEQEVLKEEQQQKNKRRTPAADEKPNHARVEVKISDEEAFILLQRFADNGMNPREFDEKEKKAMSALCIKMWGNMFSLLDILKYHHHLTDKDKPANHEAFKQRLEKAGREMGFVEDTKEEQDCEEITDKEALELLREYSENGMDLEGFDQIQLTAMNDLLVRLWGEEYSLECIASFHDQLPDKMKPKNIETMKEFVEQSQEKLKTEKNEKETADEDEEIKDFEGLMEEIDKMNSQVESGEITAEEYWQQIKIIPELVLSKKKGMPKNLSPLKKMFILLRKPMTHDFAGICTEILASYNEILKDEGFREQYEVYMDMDAKLTFYLFDKYVKAGFEKNEALQMILATKRNGLMKIILENLSNEEKTAK